jgi:LDH2 family malate/lactate/ureidoglycolate dehydrogenase
MARATAAADAVLSGGAFGPFGGHKGSAIALMVELMGRALTGGDFGFEDRSSAFTGAQSSSAGEYLCSPARRYTNRARALAEAEFKQTLS